MSGNTPPTPSDLAGVHDSPLSCDIDQNNAGAIESIVEFGNGCPVRTTESRSPLLRPSIAVSLGPSVPICPRLSELVKLAIGGAASPVLAIIVADEQHRLVASAAQASAIERHVQGTVRLDDIAKVAIQEGVTDAARGIKCIFSARSHVSPPSLLLYRLLLKLVKPAAF